MEDIYDIKGILLWIPINYMYSIVFTLFLLILFIIYKYILSKNNANLRESINFANNEKEIKKDFYKALNDFENIYLKETENIFYSKLLYIFREILEYNWEKNISKMTLEEINKLKLNNNIKSLIKNLYYKEYMEKIKDNNEIRKQFIEDIKKIIK